MKKGGPRSTLYQLCKKQQWPMPTFETDEEKSRFENSILSGTSFSLAKFLLLIRKWAHAFFVRLEPMPGNHVLHTGPAEIIANRCKFATIDNTDLRIFLIFSRVAIEFDDGVEKRKGFSSFTSRINLYIPNHGSIECTGDPRADKKGSFDSAALGVLHELEKRGRIIISG